jgi:hypothetical protein
VSNAGFCTNEVFIADIFGAGGGLNIKNIIQSAIRNVCGSLDDSRQSAIPA